MGFHLGRRFKYLTKTEKFTKFITIFLNFNCGKELICISYKYFGHLLVTFPLFDI